MSSPEPRRRRGAHRTGRSVVAALMPSVLAVLAVTALVTSLAVWRGEETVQPGAAASTTSPSGASREALSQAPSTSSPANSPAAPSTSAPPPSTDSADQATGSADLRDVQVVVLNQTSRSGLAGSVADQLRGKGWNVPAVGNFRGIVPATTVYYPAGEEAAAQAAAESLPTAPRTRPRFGNLSTTRLTVVVTDSYPS
jgi:hypothetical protein